MKDFHKAVYVFQKAVDEDVKTVQLVLQPVAENNLQMFNGYLENFAFFTGAITQAEYSWLYNGGIGRQYSELGQAGDGSALLDARLTAFWEFDEYSAATGAITRRDLPV